MEPQDGPRRRLRPRNDRPSYKDCDFEEWLPPSKRSRTIKRPALKVKRRAPPKQPLENSLESGYLISDYAEKGYAPNQSAQVFGHDSSRVCMEADRDDKEPAAIQGLPTGLYGWTATDVEESKVMLTDSYSSEANSSVGDKTDGIDRPIEKSKAAIIKSETVIPHHSDSRTSANPASEATSSITTEGHDKVAEINFKLQKLNRQKAKVALEKRQAEIEAKQLQIEDEEAELREQLRLQQQR